MGACLDALKREVWGTGIDVPPIFDPSHNDDRNWLRRAKHNPSTRGSRRMHPIDLSVYEKISFFHLNSIAGILE